MLDEDHIVEVDATSETDDDSAADHSFSGAATATQAVLTLAYPCFRPF